MSIRGKGLSFDFAHAATRRRGHGRGSPWRGSWEASERKHDEEEERREVDTRRDGECWPLVHPNILLVFVFTTHIEA